jgi:hypothetical protein
MTADQKMSEDDKVKLLAGLLLSEPWKLVAVGLGSIKGEDLARALLKLIPKKS